MPGIIKTIRMLGVSSVCFVCLMSETLLADNCRDVYLSALTQLQQIETELLSISSKKQYQESVTQRYDMIEASLNLATECDASQLDVDGQRDVHQLRMVLSSLQASAQASAFTKFADWVTAKELDLSLCRRMAQAAPEEAGQVAEQQQ